MTTMNKNEAAEYLNTHVPAYSFYGTEFQDGEAGHYAKLYRKVAKVLFASELPDTAEFEVSEGGTVKLRFAGKELPLFCVLTDTFRGMRWECEPYCDQEYLRFCSALHVCEALMASTPSRDG